MLGEIDETDILKATQPDEILHPVNELVYKSNPLPLLGVLDRIDVNSEVDGVPLLNLLCNKFVPLHAIFCDRQVQMQADVDGRTPLHYAVEVDDVKAAEWCLSRGAPDAKDNFGNTPLMDAVRLGHRRCFLLCLHFQHYSEKLPHLAAEYNRTWELKVLQSLGFSIEKSRNDENHIPLEVAVMNYSYESANYLASITDNFDMYRIRTLTDSRAMIKTVRQGKKEGQHSFQFWMEFQKYFASYFLIVLGIIVVDIYDVNRYERLVFMWILALLWMLILVLSSVCKQHTSTPQNIMHLLQEPEFPVLADICPQSLNFQETTEQYCRKCGSCVEKFHFHSFLCINAQNQVLWYLYEFGITYFSWVLFRQIIDFHCFRTIRTAQDFNFITLFFRLIETTVNRNILEFAFFLFLFFFLCHQIFLCLSMIGMMFMDRTYQQVIHTERYPHLYQPFKGKDKKIRNKERRIFGTYKFCGGLIIGIKNAIIYFF